MLPCNWRVTNCVIVMTVDATGGGVKNSTSHVFPPAGDITARTLTFAAVTPVTRTIAASRSAAVDESDSWADVATGVMEGLDKMKAPPCRQH